MANLKYVPSCEDVKSWRIKLRYRTYFFLFLLFVPGFLMNCYSQDNSAQKANELLLNNIFSQEKGAPLPHTGPLTWDEPLDVLMRRGIHRFLDNQTVNSVKLRERNWNRDQSDLKAYDRSVASNRNHLTRIIGAVDERAEPQMLGLTTDKPALVSKMAGYSIYEVRWPALKPVTDLTENALTKQDDWPILKGPVQIEGEGLLLRPKGKCRGYVIVLPDADQTPEQLAGLVPGVAPESQLSRRLVENGFCVISPVLLSRDTDFSKGIKSNERTHRDWIYTPAFELGRHPVGYEVQKVSAAVDWCLCDGKNRKKVAVAGYGEGGMIAMYASAVDTRIDAALISGYFGPRENMWQEPLYRNIWGLLAEFGDAEIATLIAPRKMIVEYSHYPEWERDVPNTGPGKLNTPTLAEVRSEFERINSLIPGFGKRSLISGDSSSAPFFGESAIKELTAELGTKSLKNLSAGSPVDKRIGFNPMARQERAVKQMENHTQLLLRNSEYQRDSLVFNSLSFDTENDYEESADSLRKVFKYEHIGWFDMPLLKELQPRSRKIYDEEKWVGYDVVIDVWPDVFAWGVLCIPKDLKPGEKRPVVICQHGLEGTPYSTIDAKEDYHYYKSFTARLAEEGFITFAPFNLYRGENDFRSMQRKANPLKASLYSIIIPQNSQILNWLETLPFVDKDRIGYYGLSYGGKSAMRIPAIEERFKLSICSADFNEWVRINADIHFPTAYMYRGSEYEMVEWDLGHSFNYAEMTYLIAPRPFMVERGRSDNVGIDSWVTYEFLRARRVYDRLGSGDRCVIEYFDGPHSINGKGTFEFLHRELNWPKGE